MRVKGGTESEKGDIQSNGFKNPFLLRTSKNTDISWVLSDIRGEGV